MNVSVLRVGNASNIFRVFALCGLLIGVSGCASIVERTRSITSNTGARWETIGDIGSSFASIILHETDTSALEQLGFGPDSPNVTRVHFLDVARSVSGLLLYKDGSYLPDGVRECIRAQERCSALVMAVENIRKRGTEEFADRILFDKEVDVVSGWRFESTVFMVDDVAVYTAANKTPNVSRIEKSKDPLHLLETILNGALSTGMKAAF